jgi:hypothetical protein
MCVRPIYISAIYDNAKNKYKKQQQQKPKKQQQQQQQKQHHNPYRTPKTIWFYLVCRKKQMTSYRPRH